MLEISCGVILFTMENATAHYLLIRDQHGNCGFPKGHMEAGETEAETALREVWVETSIRPKLIPGFREEIRYSMNNGNDKKVVFYLGRFCGQTPSRNAGLEQFDFILLPFQKALDRLSFAHTKAVLQRADVFVRWETSGDPSHKTARQTLCHDLRGGQNH